MNAFWRGQEIAFVVAYNINVHFLRPKTLLLQLSSGVSVPSHGLPLPHKINSPRTAETLTVSNCNLHHKHPAGLLPTGSSCSPLPNFPASPTSSLRTRATTIADLPLNRAAYIASFQSLFAFSLRPHLPLELSLLHCIDHVACYILAALVSRRPYRPQSCHISDVDTAIRTP